MIIFKKNNVFSIQLVGRNFTKIKTIRLGM